MSRMSRFGGVVFGLVGMTVVTLAFEACDRNNGQATPPETPITDSVPAPAEQPSAPTSALTTGPRLSVDADGGVSQSPQ
jgi:hypothetical protein